MTLAQGAPGGGFVTVFPADVATPPNALVYGSGLVPVRDMLRVGLLLDLAGVATIALVVLLLGRWVLPAA